MALVVLTEKSLRQSLESLFRKTIYVLIPFSVLLVKYFTALGVSYTRSEGELMWLGVTTHKNGLGRLCLISVFFLIWTLIRRWKTHDIPVSKYQNYVDTIMLGISLWLLKGPSAGSYSATSISTLAFGSIIYPFIVTTEAKHSGDSNIILIKYPHKLSTFCLINLFNYHFELIDSSIIFFILLFHKSRKVIII